MNPAGADTLSLLVTSTLPVQVLPAVPEPETWAMMLAGLGLVGMTKWRRKRTSAS